jgi:hypothetical protein
MERGLTPIIVHYVKRIPIICQKLKYIKCRHLSPGETSERKFQQILLDVCKQLLFDELEIIQWVKYIERYEFDESRFAVDLFFIALGTKLLMNKKNEKEPFEVHLYHKNTNFIFFNSWISKYSAIFYQDNSELIKTHQIYKKLRKGYEPAFNYDEWKQRKQDEELLEKADLNEMVDQIEEWCSSSRPSLSRQSSKAPPLQLIEEGDWTNECDSEESE